MSQKKCTTLTLFICLIAFVQISGCSDSGSVGDSLPGSGSDLQVDTLQLTQLQVDTLESFSGSLPFFSAGRFQDPLFGDVEATGLLKPALPGRNDDLSFGGDTRMQLRLAINESSVYGDTLAGGSFDVIELANIFRGNAFRLNDEVQTTGPVLGSFTITNEDTAQIELADEWVRRYGEFYNSTESNRDSSYVREFFGLAVVPQNSAKIIAINAGQSRFTATNLSLSENADSTLSDSINIDIREAAFSLDRSNGQNSEPGTSKIISTVERVMRFDFDFSLDNLGSENISRVELVIPRDNLMLEQSLMQAGANAVRPIGGILRLHLVDGDELPQSIDPGVPIAGGAYQEDDEAYHINLTQNVLSRQFENRTDDQTFYITLGVNDGAIRSSVLFDSRAAAENIPKVIVTSIKTENN